MKLLVVQGSPNEQSFCRSNALNYVNQAKLHGHNVDLIDLSQGDFDPVLKFGYMKHMADEEFPLFYQNKVKIAEHLVFFFPIWWSAEPAILKGWIDRVFTPNFAYRYQDLHTEKLLINKTADLYLSSRAPGGFYKIFGLTVSRWKRFVLGYCGIKLKRALVLGSMGTDKDTESRRKDFIKKCAKF